jgi:hypothetical protein
MFIVSEAEAAAIRTAFDQGGDTDNGDARACARTIAGRTPLWPLKMPRWVVPPATVADQIIDPTMAAAMPGRATLAWCWVAGDRRALLVRPTLAASGGTAVQERNRSNEMSDDLTNSQIALLCDIGEFDLPKLTSDQKRDLERLVSGGYVEPTESRARSAFGLTAKGLEFLGNRGAGLNEA